MPPSFTIILASHFVILVEQLFLLLLYTKCMRPKKEGWSVPPVVKNTLPLSMSNAPAWANCQVDWDQLFVSASAEGQVRCYKAYDCSSRSAIEVTKRA
jgi:hypothetical protein